MGVKRVAIVHYMPVEIYPPVMNLVNTWDKLNTGIKMDVYSTSLPDVGKEFKPGSSLTRVHRFSSSGKRRNFLSGLIHYFHYYFFTLFQLIRTRPANILYYDTISSFPAVIYTLLFNGKAGLMIHHNEYMSATEYENGMFLVRVFHQLEKKIYGRATWISHTNKERIRLFLADLPGKKMSEQQVVPNFPPANWTIDRNAEIHRPIRIVYTGALSMDTMYTRLFAEWVLQQGGRVTWDIYSLNVTDDAASYIKSLATNSIQLQKGVDYYELPGILNAYDVGIILYNGHIPNYIYNAPNKLFEYAACGLDVWFPVHMESSLEYVTANSYPKIVALDFESLSTVKAEDLVTRKDLVFQRHSFSCETVLLPLLKKLAG